jgi:hypothetical protein
VGRRTVLGADDLVLDEVEYIVIWKRESGQWRRHQDIFNSRRGG